MFHTPQLLACTKDQNMAPKISVLFLMVLALGISSLASPDNGVQEINTLNDDYHLKDPNMEDVAMDDTTQIEEGHYEEQESDSERERRASKRCGPDITHWLVQQMNQNRNHIEIRRCRAWYKYFAWPRCLKKFADHVGNRKPWDFKRTQSFTRGSCPQGCPRTVTLCR